MRFKVTGGADGVSGIEVDNRRYEPGDIVEMTGSKADWLLEQGYLEPADGKGKTAPEPEPAPEPAPSPEPAAEPAEPQETE